jgi:guanylate kinase
MEDTQNQIRRGGILFILMGPTGSGKTTLCDRLVQEFSADLKYSVSVTSRSPRPGEVDGTSYHFLSRESFLKRREAGEFFEWEETHGNLYGTLQSSLIDGINTGKDLLFQVDIRGALNFKRQFPKNTVTIFLVPPKFEVMRERLKARGTTDPVELERRFKTAQSEYEALLDSHTSPVDIDYVVVNSAIDVAYDRVRAIVMAERARYHRMEKDSVGAFCEVSV